VSYDGPHAFVEVLGIPRRAFERDHDDIPAHLQETGIAAGVRLVGATELATRLHAVGLRHR
jgi:hypothetical protein